MTPDNTWYTVATAAHRLGISLNSCYLLLGTGQLPAYRVGPRRGRYRITEAQIAAYLDASTTKTSTAAARVRARAVVRVRDGMPDGSRFKHV